MTKSMRWATTAAVVGIASLTCLTEISSAAPTVTVKARTAIEIDPIRRDLDGIVVRGRVVDKITRAPVGWVDVVVHLDQLERRAVTDRDGAFEARFQVTGGRHDLAVSFAGDLHHDPSRYQIANFDVTKNPLDLVLQLSRSVASYGEDPLTISLEAKSDFGGVAIPVNIYMGAETDDPDDLPRIGTITTATDGSGKLELAPDRLGDPGRKLVVARYPGNRAYDAAEAQIGFAIKSDTAITFEVTSGELAYEADLQASGQVTDARGGGVGGGAVSLVVGSRHIADTATDADGRYAFKVSASELGSGKFNVQAVFEPARDWHRQSRSAPATVVVAQPEPVPVSYTIAAFAATTFALLAFIGMRTRPWEAWLARWRAKRADEDEDGADDDGDASAIHTGLSLARPSLVSTLRRTKDQGFAGVIRNAVSHRPVGGARLVLRHEDGRVEEESADGGGRFSFEMLAVGRWQVDVTAYGFVTESFAVAVPHRGELRGARVDLLPVRERIFALYGQAARPMLPDPAMWGVWTPRQIFDHVRDSRPPASAMASLTDFVEETYFSQRVPDEGLIAEARERIARATAEGPPSTSA